MRCTGRSEPGPARRADVASSSVGCIRGEGHDNGAGEAQTVGR